MGLRTSSEIRHKPYLHDAWVVQLGIGLHNTINYTNNGQRFSFNQTGFRFCRASPINRGGWVGPKVTRRNWPGGPGGPAPASQDEPGKLRIARRLWAETTMALDWIAQRCGWGFGHVSNLLASRPRKGMGTGKK
jgi:hypothetical protein